MKLHLFASVALLAAVASAHAGQIPFTYARLSGNPAYEDVFHGHSRDDPKASVGEPFFGKRLYAISRIRSVTIWNEYGPEVSMEFVRAHLPRRNVLSILKHYSLRAAREQDFINIPAGTMVDIHYRNGFTLRINTLESTAYEGVFINPQGKCVSVGFWYNGEE